MGEDSGSLLKFQEVTKRGDHYLLRVNTVDIGSTLLSDYVIILYQFASQREELDMCRGGITMRPRERYYR